MKGAVTSILLTGFLLAACRERTSLEKIAAEPEGPHSAVTQTVPAPTTQTTSPTPGVTQSVSNEIYLLEGRNGYRGGILAHLEGGKVVVPDRSLVSMTSTAGPSIQSFTTPGPHAGSITLLYTAGGISTRVDCSAQSGYGTQCADAKQTVDYALAAYRK